jgi:hypothetical protein
LVARTVAQRSVVAALAFLGVKIAIAAAAVVAIPAPMTLRRVQRIESLMHSPCCASLCKFIVHAASGLMIPSASI